MARHSSYGAGAPTTIPKAINQHYTNTTNGDQYIAKGTSSPSDWVLQGGGSVSSVFGRAGAVVAQPGDYSASDVGADPSGTAATAISDHLAATDPHPQYLTPAEGNSAYDSLGAASTVQSNLNSHTGNTSNPHSTNKTQVGLPNVDNTSDLNKPVSTAQQAALDLKLTKNTAIVPATKSKITYDANGLITSGADMAMNDNSDVQITSPALNDFLKYNGSKWVNDQIVIPASGGNGVDYFLTATLDSGTGYDLMSKSPDAATEVDESIVVNNNTLSFENYIADVVLGGSQIDAGIWNFNIYAYVSALTGTTKLLIDIYKRTSGGTETLLFTVDSGNIVSTSVELILIPSVQSAFSNNPTDKLVFKFRATTTSVTNVTVHLVHSGSVHYTYVNTPLIVRHNDLSGIQGGTSGEQYHLTNSEYTGTGTGDFVRKDSPTFTGTVGGISKAMVGLPLVPNVDTTNPANISQNASYRFTTDTEKSTWNSKEPGLAAGTTGQYYRGDKSWQTLDKAAVGIPNVDNTSDANKPISTATQTALSGKENSLGTGTAGQFLAHDKTWQTPPTGGGGISWSQNTVSNSTLSLLVGSNGGQMFSGTVGGQVVQLPDATTLAIGRTFYLVNGSDPLLKVNDGSGTFKTFLMPTREMKAILRDNSTAAGIWSMVSYGLDNDQFRYFDHFLAAGTTSGAVGNLGWTITGGTVAYQTITSPSQGVLRVNTGTGNNGQGALNLGATNMLLNRPIVTRCRFSLPSIGGTGAAALALHLGLLNATTNVSPGTNPLNAIGFSFAGSNAAAANIFAFASNATLTSTIDTATQLVAATFYDVSFCVNAAGTVAYFYFNNSFIGSINTTVPTGIPIGQMFKISSGATNAAAKSGDVDLWDTYIL